MNDSAIIAKLHKPSLLLNWLSIGTDGVGIVWATRHLDRKPRIDNGLNNPFGFWRRFRLAGLAVVPNDTLLLGQFLQRFPKRLYGGRGAAGTWRLFP